MTASIPPHISPSTPSGDERPDSPAAWEWALFTGALALMLALSVRVVAKVGWRTAIASHFDAVGAVNGTMPAAMAMAVAPLLVAVIGGLLLGLGGRRGVTSAGRRVVLLVVVLPPAIAHAHIGLRALGIAHTFVVSPPVVLGAILTVVGNVMGKLRRNAVIGVRLPWTLRDDWVWERTHRFAGRVHVAAGLLLLFLGVLAPTGGLGAGVVLPVLAAPALSSVLAARHFWAIRPDRTP